MLCLYSKDLTASATALARKVRFQVEELFLDSKSCAFELEGSRLRNAKSLERLYLVAALALLAD